jgi:Protein of unknown function (DUF3311)
MIMAESSPGQYNAYRARASARPIPAPPPWAGPSRANPAHGLPARSLQDAATGTYRQTRRPVDEVRRKGDDRAARHLVEHPTDSSAWHWLLWLPVVLPLITPLYNRVEPRWAGIPFFYWFQLSFVALDIAVVTFVYQVTKRRHLS